MQRCFLKREAMATECMYSVTVANHGPWMLSLFFFVHFFSIMASLAPLGPNPGFGEKVGDLYNLRTIGWQVLMRKFIERQRKMNFNFQSSWSIYLSFFLFIIFISEMKVDAFKLMQLVFPDEYIVWSSQFH